jgi:chloramphenicol 3-O-phosphotransferase
MLQDSIKMTGELRITVTNPEGNIKQEVVVPNLVVTAGKGYIASRMKDTTATAMSHMEIGTGTTAAAVGDTALETAVSGSRVSLTSTTVTANAVAYVATFPAGTGTGAITEAGIFNASSSGTMLCRTVFSVINKGAADTLGITWTVTVN